MAQNTPQHARNWSIWRMRQTTGAKLREVADAHNVSIERARQVVAKHDRHLRWLMYQDINGHAPSEHVRDGLLGVEFVFTHECLLVDTKGWDSAPRGNANGTWTMWTVKKD